MWRYSPPRFQILSYLQAERGVVNKGDEVEILGHCQRIKTTVTGIEMFRKELDRGEAGDNMGVLLRGIKRELIGRGLVIAAPGTMKSAKKFLAQIYVCRQHSSCMQN